MKHLVDSQLVIDNKTKSISISIGHLEKYIYILSVVSVWDVI